MKLLIAVPAYNEQGSITSVIKQCLTASPEIIAQSPVEDVQITVVSDGSTDRTVELAERFGDKIRLIAFEKNRGYGAAIKAAWLDSDADLLGFLDADGTCDPSFFGPLCRTLVDEGADIVLGCRLHASSRMPVIRRVGNAAFAAMLTMFSSTRVRDTASGMRVVRRSCLSRLMPLPDGLHFTPAMSARAILSDDLVITEIDMDYHEREGESKLRLGKDGIRFLRVILEAALLYRPSRPLGLLGLVCLTLATGLMITPALYYLQNRSVAEWMIYRFVISNLLGTMACLLFCTSYLSKRIVRMTLSETGSSRKGLGPLGAFFSSRFFWVVPTLLVAVGTVLVAPSVLEFVILGASYEHWSRFIVMSFFFSVAIILIVTRVVDYSLTLIAERVAYLKSPPV